MTNKDNHDPLLFDPFDANLENLCLSNLALVYDVTIKINEALQLSSSQRIRIDLYYEIDFSKMQTDTKTFDEVLCQYDLMKKNEELVDRRMDALSYLHRSRIIIDFRCIPTEVYGSEPKTIMEMDVDIPKLREFLPKITKIYREKGGKEQKSSALEIAKTMNSQSAREDKQIIYKIAFALSNEIILNDLVVLSRPNLNSENAEVFAYLMENPNRTIKKKEIEEKIGRSIGKDLHKIVENLGFTGNLRKAFFKVSNNAIFFRNPITNTDFEQLGIPPLKIVQK